MEYSLAFDLRVMAPSLSFASLSVMPSLAASFSAFPSATNWLIFSLRRENFSIVSREIPAISKLCSLLSTAYPSP